MKYIAVFLLRMGAVLSIVLSGVSLELLTAWYTFTSGLAQVATFGVLAIVFIIYSAMLEDKWFPEQKPIE